MTSSHPPTSETTRLRPQGDASAGSPAADAPATSSLGMLLAFTPWLLFSVMTHRVGASAAGFAALAAAALGIFLILRQGHGHRAKLLDLTGVVLFSILAVVAFVGGAGMDDWIADFGRAGCSFVLAAVMLVSVLSVPFSEQYARESVPQEHWSSPVFRATNRKISLCWGLVVLVMALGHTVAGIVDPTSTPESGFRLVDLLLNWGLPAVLVLGAVKFTNKVAAAAGSRATDRGIR